VRFRRNCTKRFKVATESTKVQNSLFGLQVRLSSSALTLIGTWVPLEKGEELAHRNGIYEKLRTIFEFVPGNDSPPPAPKHTTNKPKAPKKPAVPKFHSSEFLIYHAQQTTFD
jgi:hypothetical protein